MGTTQTAGAAENQAGDTILRTRLDTSSTDAGSASVQDAPATAFVQTEIAPDPVTGSAAVFAQRYAADNTKIGAPVQVTSGDLAADLVAGVTLLANNGFVVDYYYRDVTDEINEGLVQVTQDNLAVPVISLPYYEQPSYAVYALSNGAVAYIAYQNIGNDLPIIAASLGFSDAAGKGFTIPLVSEAIGAGPYPSLVFGDVSIQLLPGDKFSASYSQSFTPPDPNFPGIPAGPSGQETFTQVYSDDGVLLARGFTSFDNTRTLANLNSAGQVIESETYNAAGQLVSVAGFDASGRLTGSTTRGYDDKGVLSYRSAATFDPTSGKLLQSTTVEADGARTEVNYAVAGKPYATQFASYDAAGHLTDLFRTFGDANNTLAFTQVHRPDGSSDVHSYDTAGRETTHIAAAADGSKHVVNSTYVGAATIPSTTADYRYGASGQLLAVDTVGANGSHAQVAKAAGVTLTSTFLAADSLTGAGSTTFVFTPGSGQDLVTNFHAGAGAGHDVIDLSGFAVIGQPGQSAVDGLLHSLKQSGRDVILALAPTDDVTLKNTAVASLTKQNFRVG